MITRIHHVVAPLLFVLGVGFTFTPLGCGSSIPPNVPMPGDGDLARQLRSCAAEHEGHLGSTSQSISFDVHLDENGDVDSVALREATIGDEGLEACMAHALRSLTVDDLPMRLSGSGPEGAVAPESRAFLGQAELPLDACLASPPCALALGLFIGAAFIAVTVYVYANSTSLVHAQAKTLAATRIRRRSKDDCTKMFTVCQAIAGPCTRVTTKGHTVCEVCRSDCQIGKAYSYSSCYTCGFE